MSEAITCKRCRDTGRVGRVEYDAASDEMEWAGTDPCPDCEQARKRRGHCELIARLNELAEDYEQNAECDTTPKETRRLYREFAAQIREVLG